MSMSSVTGNIIDRSSSAAHYCTKSESDRFPASSSRLLYRPRKASTPSTNVDFLVIADLGHSMGVQIESKRSAYLRLKKFTDPPDNVFISIIGLSAAATGI